LFERQRYRRMMTDVEPLTPASRDDLEQAIAFALQFRGRKHAFGPPATSRRR
jgi:hypothetical protein